MVVLDDPSIDGARKKLHRTHEWCHAHGITCLKCCAWRVIVRRKATPQRDRLTWDHAKRRRRREPPSHIPVFAHRPDVCRCRCRRPSGSVPWRCIVDGGGEARPNRPCHRERLVAERTGGALVPKAGSHRKQDPCPIQHARTRSTTCSTMWHVGRYMSAPTRMTGSRVRQGNCANAQCGGGQ
jgi:hypothetical protein